MSEKESNKTLEIEEEDMITLEFDDNTAVDCFIMGTFECDGKEYIALAPDDGTDDVFIYGYEEISDDAFDLIEIEDDEEFDRVVEVFDAIMEELEEE